MAYLSFIPPATGLAGLFTQDPGRYGPLMELGKYLMTGDSELARGERELIAAFVSALNACSFCFGTHSSIARAFGWPVEVIEALLDDPAGAPIPERLAPIMALARKLTVEPARVAQRDVDAVLAADWSEETVSDVIAISAYYAMTNRLASGHGIEALRASDNQAIGRQIAEHGYPGLDGLAAPHGESQDRAATRNKSGSESEFDNPNQTGSE